MGSLICVSRSFKRDDLYIGDPSRPTCNRRLAHTRCGFTYYRLTYYIMYLRIPITSTVFMGISTRKVRYQVGKVVEPALPLPSALLHPSGTHPLFLVQTLERPWSILEPWTSSHASLVAGSDQDGNGIGGISL